MTTPAQPDPATEHIGPFTLYRRENRDAKGPHYLLSWAGTWLPGTYADRDAAILAIGLVIGGESRFYLDDLRTYAQQQNTKTGYITIELIMTALAKATE